jgi:hypothetical protein
MLMPCQVILFAVPQDGARTPQRRTVLWLADGFRNAIPRYSERIWLQGHHLSGFVLSLFCKLVGAFGVFECAFRMPASLVSLAFLIVFGGGSVGICGELVLFGSHPVCVMHTVLL